MIPSACSYFSLVQNRPDRLCGPPTSLLKGTGGGGREVYHLPPSNAEVKNEWRYTSNSNVCHYDVHRDNFFVFLNA